MRILTLTVAMLLAGAHMLGQSDQASQCLHGSDETTFQSQRRGAALGATRNINNLQAWLGVRGSYYSHEELATAPEAVQQRQSGGEAMRRLVLDPNEEILPGWKLTLDASARAYWFMIRDTADPCGFAFISNQSGVIYTAEPIR